MIVISCILGAGVAVGVVVGLLARRWPAVEAPAIPTAVVAEEVDRHPGFADRLRARRDPQAITGLALTVAVAAIALGAAGIGILLAMIRADNGFASFDERLARFAAVHATDLSTTFARTLSLLGGTSGMIALGLAVGIVEYRRTPTRAVPAFLALCLLGQFAVANFIKLLVDRARPAIDQLTGFDSTSFPSGHATAAAAGFAAAALLLGRRRPLRTKAVLAGVGAGIAASVGATRVFLGVHWFTDVLAGLLLGWTWFALCSIAFGGRLLRFGVTVERAEQVAEEEAVLPG